MRFGIAGPIQCCPCIQPRPREVVASTGCILSIVKRVHLKLSGDLPKRAECIRDWSDMASVASKER